MRLLFALQGTSGYDSDCGETTENTERYYCFILMARWISVRGFLCLHRDLTQESTAFLLTAGPYPVLGFSEVNPDLFQKHQQNWMDTPRDNKTLAGLLLPTSRSGGSLTSTFNFEGWLHCFVTSHLLCCWKPALVLQMTSVQDWE